MLKLIEDLQSAFRTHVRNRYQLEIEGLIAENSPRLEFGELAFPFAFELAKKLKRAPRQIAQEIAAEIKPPAGVARVEPAGAGYINVFLDRWTFLQSLAHPEPYTPADPGKVIVEHTNINPNKAAHIGHLRNAVIGDSFVRMLRFLGYNVETQNYIDNTGVQVADVVVGFIHLRRMTLDQIRRIEGKFDYFCWDLYAEVSQWYQGDSERLSLRNRALHEIEHGIEPTASIADYVSTEVVKTHLRTMQRINARYDLLPRESEILHLRFWEKAFQLLKERGAIEHADDGPQKGCWIMKFGPEADASLPDAKIIVRSNGTVTYVGKDIAYQMWKFGLLGRDFHYTPFYCYPDGQQAWMTTMQSPNGAPAFGKARRVYNVIDSRQSYLQKIVIEGLRALSFHQEAENSIHFSYEMVALSPRCCSEMGIQLSPEDASRPYIEVSGRKGLGVKADDLLDRLLLKSREEVDQRKNFEDPAEAEKNASQIAVAALRYFLAKFARNSVIAFDFQEALSFEGETGPYVQYAAVRSNNIFRKLEAEQPGWKQAVDSFCSLKSESLSEAARSLLRSDAVWELLLLNGRVDQAVRQAVDSLEVSAIAKHAFNLAQKFNLFYHRHHILSEPDPSAQQLLLAVAQVTRDSLTRLLDLLGIEVPAKM